MERTYVSKFWLRVACSGALLAPLICGAAAWSQTAVPAKAPAKPAVATPLLAARLDLTEWRYRDGLEPSATAANFDDSKWEVIRDPAQGRGNGGASYGWYRAVVTVPEKIGAMPVAGKPLQLSVLADDYAEVWIDGDFKFQYDPDQSPTAPKNRPLGYEIAGLDKANVVALGARKPGDKFVVAIVVANGPLGKPVGKYLLRHARLELAPTKP
jgi:hypothetical protein